MRVCVFCSRIDRERLESTAWLVNAHPVLAAARKEDIYIVSYRLPGGIEASGNIYFPWGQKSFRMALCRGILRLVDTHRWIPSVVAWVPLKLCQKEFAEVVLACDPDVVVLSDIRWGGQFASVLKEISASWRFLTSFGEDGYVSPVRKVCDTSRKVSIVLPTYNGSKYISRSIESCLSQTFANLELLVVDDASSDDTAKIVREYRDPRIRYFRHERNRGIAEGLNTGFQNSTGEYVTWTSDDNFYADNAIEEMVRFLQSYPHVDFVYAENYIVNEGKTTWTGGEIRRNEPPESLTIDNFVGACFLYTRTVLEKIGRYNPKTFLAEDYDYWVRVAKRFRMQRLFKRLYYYRFHGDSLTSKSAAETVKAKVNLVKEMHGLRSL